MSKKTEKKTPTKRPHCKEHSCAKPRGTVEGFCAKHSNPRERHHDKGGEA